MVQVVDWVDDRDQPDPQNPGGDWRENRIVDLRYQRPGMSSDTRQAVDRFGDGQAHGIYKHHVPWDRIFQAMRNNLQDRKRWQGGQYLGNAIRTLGIRGIGVDPEASRVNFDMWVTWAMEEICDWPDNIFRWDYSSGDRGGTAIDDPWDDFHQSVPPGLVQRLRDARHLLQAATGVSLH
jgi:hypothetical protein